MSLSLRATVSLGWPETVCWTETKVIQVAAASVSIGGISGFSASTITAATCNLGSSACFYRRNSSS